MGKQNIEIERRWIVKTFKEPIEKIHALPYVHISQGYLDIPGRLRVRIYHGDGNNHWSYFPSVPRAELTRKTGGGLQRIEENASISVEAAKMLLWTTGCTIEKTRYFRDGWELDFFKGKLEGLVLAERELKTIDESCPIPDWLEVGPEVTDTLSNRILAGEAQYMVANRVEKLSVDDLIRKYVVKQDSVY